MERALCNDVYPLQIVNDHGHSLAYEVEWNFRDLANAAKIRRSSFQDHFVERAGHAGFERRIAGRQIQHAGDGRAEGSA